MAASDNAIAPQPKYWRTIEFSGFGPEYNAQLLSNIRAPHEASCTLDRPVEQVRVGRG